VICDRWDGGDDNSWWGEAPERAETFRKATGDPAPNRVPGQWTRRAVGMRGPRLRLRPPHSRCCFQTPCYVGQVGASPGLTGLFLRRDLSSFVRTVRSFGSLAPPGAETARPITNLQSPITYHLSPAHTVPASPGEAFNKPDRGSERGLDIFDLNKLVRMMA
jgi:hypothetical protein